MCVYIYSLSVCLCLRSSPARSPSIRLGSADITHYYTLISYNVYSIYIYIKREIDSLSPHSHDFQAFCQRPASISFQNQQDLAGSLVSIFWNVVGKSEGHLTQVTCTSRSRNSKLQFLSTPGLVGWPEVEKAIPLWLQFSRCQLFVNTLATCWKKTWNTQIPICVLHGPI